MSNSCKKILKQISVELKSDIEKFTEEVDNIKPETPKTFSAGMLAYAKKLKNRIDYEIKRR